MTPPSVWRPPQACFGMSSCLCICISDQKGDFFLYTCISLYIYVYTLATVHGVCYQGLFFVCVTKGSSSCVLPRALLRLTFDLNRTYARRARSQFSDCILALHAKGFPVDAYIPQVYTYVCIHVCVYIYIYIHIYIYITNTCCYIPFFCHFDDEPAS
jgi:hypothetical protein